MTPGAFSCQVLETDRALLKKRGTGVLAARVARVAELLAARGFLLVHDLPKLVQVWTLSFPVFSTGSLKLVNIFHTLKTCSFLLVHAPLPFLSSMLRVKG